MPLLPLIFFVTIQTPASEVDCARFALPQTYTASACPAFFGSPDEQSAQTKRRRRRLRTVDVSPYSIDIVHSTKWSEPVPVHFADMALVGVVERTACGNVALVKVPSAFAARAGCAGGVYTLRRDVSIGAKNAVIYIGADMILVEHDGKLQYVTVTERAAPVFRMIWISPWRMHASGGSDGGGGSSMPPRPMMSPPAPYTPPPWIPPAGR